MRSSGFPSQIIYAIVVQLVVRHLAKVEVASSSLVYRSSNPEIQRQISGFLFATMVAPTSAIQGRIIPKNPAKLRILFSQDSAQRFVMTISSSHIKIFCFKLFLFEYSIILECQVEKMEQPYIEVCIFPLCFLFYFCLSVYFLLLVLTLRPVRHPQSMNLSKVAYSRIMALICTVFSKMGDGIP